MSSPATRSLGFPALTALLTGVVAALLYAAATKRHGEPVPALVYPYLASASVFLTTCVWIVAKGSAEATGKADSKAAKRRRWWAAGLTFAVTFAALTCFGTAGTTGSSTIGNLNWYFFGKPGDAVDQTGLLSAFNLATAFGNSIALGTLVFIGMACRDVTEAATAPGQADVLEVLYQSDRLFGLLVEASALAVTSTLTLYLLFASGDQVHAMRLAAAPARPAAAASASASASARSASTATITLTLDCERKLVGEPPASGAAPATGGTQSCSFTAAPGSAPARPAASAAFMSFVVGLALSGALFILFASCNAAIDDHVRLLMRRAREAAAKRRPPQEFSVKDWRERNGITESGGMDRVLKALALLAPALTGALTLLGAG